MVKFMPKFTRRNAILGGTAGAAVLAGGGALVLSSEIESFYARLVRHYLPGEPIAPGAAEAFASDYMSADEDLSKVKPLMYMQQVAGFVGLDEILGGQGPYETFVRRVTTNFMLGSTFFQRMLQSDPVEYVSIAQVCGNPFARFD
ncbi:hypothetical protein [Croceicoccus sp. Ery5]|uniref:hypothetical protein n=1 Tax=Croceicoccus sp. Ery5 TaxID=1703340 RepID=UPI001E65078B|nr:hypothetical protein [Croceicoccus sp. Ery5]